MQTYIQKIEVQFHEVHAAIGLKEIQKSNEEQCGGLAEPPARPLEQLSEMRGIPLSALND